MTVTTSPYGARPVKQPRVRRTTAELAIFRQNLYELVEEEHPATARGIFYRAVSAGLIPKDEDAYKGIVRVLGEMRLGGSLPWRWVTDNGRAMRRGLRHGSIAEALEHTARFYRRKLWTDLPVYVEVWSEKDAISGVLLPVTSEFDVPLMVCRGYPSLTFLYEAAEEITAQGKPTYVYYLGDRDPSGMDIPANVERRLREFSPGVDLHFERIAVTHEQIARWNLPMRPTKKSDSRSDKFEGDSIEVDAIAPSDLRALVRGYISRHISEHHIAQLAVAETSERQFLRALARRPVSA